MKNVTVTLEEEVARWARVRAAEKDMSLSRFLGELLKEQMQREEAYETAMMRYLSRDPQPLKDEAETYPRREDFYERHGERHGLR
jgi:hypothetical protein